MYNISFSFFRRKKQGLLVPRGFKQSFGDKCCIHQCTTVLTFRSSSVLSSLKKFPLLFSSLRQIFSFFASTCLQFIEMDGALGWIMREISDLFTGREKPSHLFSRASFSVFMDYLISQAASEYARKMGK